MVSYWPLQKAVFCFLETIFQKIEKSSVKDKV